jgi:hypothetical protein
VSRALVFGGALAAAAVIALMLMPARTVREAPPVTRSARQPEPLVRIRETRLAGAVAATPVRLVASQDVKRVMPVGDANRVSVIAPAGRRSAVLATRNEKITVVWIY